MQKKKKRREMEPYPALKRELNLKTRQDEIEVDYLNKLNKDELEWLNKFNSEYVNASLDRENLENNLHKTKKLKQSIDKHNNERKECAYTRSKASYNLKYIDDFKTELSVDKNYEDRLISRLDKKD